MNSSGLSIRARQFIALREDLLGPRGEDAAYETNKNPKYEYVTGMLEPFDFERTMPGSLGKDDLVEFKPDSAEEDNDDDLNDFDISSRHLHPYGLPKSIGISFLLKKENASLDFCATFARYFKTEDGYKRKPFVFIEKNVDGSKDNEWNVEGDVKIKLFSNEIRDGNLHVSLFLVNNTDAKQRQKLREPDYVFQPQLRINFINYNALYPVRQFSDLSIEEEKQLSFLYRKHNALAKGHMTGAVWQDIDPERGPSGISNVLVPPDISEYVFKENGYSDSDATSFINPHLRTDFLPSYSINQTTVDVDNIKGMNKEDMDADVLAESFNSSNLFESLNKLVKAYNAWIDDQSKSLPEMERKIAEDRLDECRYACRRMETGIKLLEDKKVRLAFCFLNKAMSVQARWAKRKLVWRPFQLAFILQCIEGIAKPTSNDRNICDLLWYPTGGGKTEAYLGILIFALALRRLNRSSKDSTCYGTSAISRYTLRLLTLQQFRRSLSTMTACEFLRSKNWNPSDIIIHDEPLWGTMSFSVGLWVGGKLTPKEICNRRKPGFNPITKKSIRYVDAVTILTYKQNDFVADETSYEGEEPAQVLTCPCCKSNLAIPNKGIHKKVYDIFLTIKCKDIPAFSSDELSYDSIKVNNTQIFHLQNNNYHVLKLSFSVAFADHIDEKINKWWKEYISKKISDSKLECAAASRPGYFLKKQNKNVTKAYSSGLAYDIEIRCPNPDCELNKEEWEESIHTVEGKQVYTPILDPFRKQKSAHTSKGIPIPAFCVDAQIYAKCPSLIVATVDKFAQLPMSPKSASMFGNINMFDERLGFCRDKILTKSENKDLGKTFKMLPFLPPDIIIQDELHLIEGPLGSMVGLYETAIDALSTRYDKNKTILPKYLVSTATIKAAKDQIKSLYCRNFKEFPPQGIEAGKNFFSDSTEAHPLDDKKPGRWYVGVMAPGRGPVTPITRIWSSMLQELQAIRGDGGITGELEYFWTIVGYFNAMRELAGTLSLYHQIIPERIKIIAKRKAESERDISQLDPIELHSNILGKTDISSILEILDKDENENRTDAVFATSMFGTGVDIDKLSQMIVHGQPKTTSSYIQATGRVGRKKGALVVTFLRSTRPRDLDHYEFFTGYHSALHRYVEHLTVFPFSPGVTNKGLLPIIVAILRNGMKINNFKIDKEWSPDDPYDYKISGCRIIKEREHEELGKILAQIHERNKEQPIDRQQKYDDINNKLNSFISDWKEHAKNIDDLYYHEYAYRSEPKYNVVLGDEKHRKKGLVSINENTPTSLRDVESTMRFRD